MIASRHGGPASALLGSVAVCALVLAASAGASAQDASSENLATTPGSAAKKKTARLPPLAPAAAPGANAIAIVLAASAGVSAQNPSPDRRATAPDPSGRAARKKSAASAHVPPAPLTPSGGYAMTTKAVPLPVVSAWNGLYGGNHHQGEHLERRSKRHEYQRSVLQRSHHVEHHRYK